MIDLRRLQALRAVHQHGTVTAAAAMLHLTPSAVSHHLRELARELKLPLVEPHGRGIRLTPAALLVVEHSDALLSRWEEARSAFESYRAGEAGVLRICGFPTALSGLLAPACGILRRGNPQLTVQVSECEAEEGLDLLLADDADLVLLTPVEGGATPVDARFDQRTLLQEPLDLLVPRGHPLTRADNVSLADGAPETWVLPAPGTCDHHQRAMVLCAAAGFTPHIGHFTKDWPAISALVAHGQGISLIPRLAELPGDHAVVRLPLTGDPLPSRQILSCVRRGSREHPLIQRGLRALQEVIEARETLAACR